MQEIELKFQIPAAHLASLESAVQRLPGADGPPLPLHAAYFDTPDSHLARHKMALRVRREGENWIQTFKAGGSDAMRRLEDNRPVPRFDGAPQADVTLHREPAVIAALRQALGPAFQTAGALLAVYETVFERRTATISEPSGTVQLCLDRGDVQAGGRCAPLCEVEFELLSGDALAVIDAARQWVDRHGLWLDVQSKAYRGTRLAQAARSGGPVQCRPVPVAALAELSSTAGVLHTTFEAVAGNLSEVAWQVDGWEAAVPAWREALLQCAGLAREHTTLQSALAGSTWQRASDMIAALADVDAAPDLARSASATHWCLDVLSAMNGHSASD